jgi:hypothetical protein
MAELILTEAEQKMDLWSEMDDDALGKMVKATLFNIQDYEGESSRIMTVSAAIILASKMHESNADTATYDIDGVTCKGEPIGDFTVTVKRKRSTP